MIALEAEQQLLGCVIYENDTFDIIAAGVHPHHFYEPFHQKLFATIQADISKDRTVNPITLAGQFKDDRAFIDLGGLKYLAELVADAQPIASADYARVILNAWQMRELGAFVKMPANLNDAQEALADLRAELDRIGAEDSSDDDLEDAHSIGGAYINELARLAEAKQKTGLQTGLKSIDVRVGGLSPGDLIVVGGRPGMSKTSYGRNILYGAAGLNPDYLFLFYNLEMNKFQISARALSCEAFKSGAHFPYFILKSPTDAMIYDVGKHKEKLPRNVLISEKKRLSVDDVRRSIAKTKAKYKKPIGAIVIDYLQLMQRPNVNKSDASVIGDMTAELKRIAGDNGITIILISQLSRGVESRDNKRPVLSDLRDSGSIEQDASIVQFPYREHYYLKMAAPQKDTDSAAYKKWEDDCEAIKNDMEVITAKIREGEAGTDLMWCSMPHDYVGDHKPDAGGEFSF